MSKPKKPAPDYAVDDPAEAFRKLEVFARKVLSVPKAEIDKRLAAEKAKTNQRKRRA